LIGSFQFDQFERCTRLIGWICSGFVIMFWSFLLELKSFILSVTSNFCVCYKFCWCFSLRSSMISSSMSIFFLPFFFQMNKIIFNIHVININKLCMLIIW
jgi:hypothetical protein